jgi:hypothetical protein
LPASWRLLARAEDNSWQPVKGASEYRIQKNDPVRLTFEPVTTRALKLEIQLPERFSAGLYEWQVE